MSNKLTDTTALDTDRSLEDNFRLNILCYPLGSTPEEPFDKVVTLLNSSLTKISLSSSSQAELRDKGKDAVPNQDWEKNLIRCHYCIRNPIIEWSECQICYKCHGSIIVLDASGYDTKKFPEDIARVKKNMLNDQLVAYRLLVFNCPEEKASVFQEEKFCAVYAPDMPENIPFTNISREVENLICTTAAHLFGEIARLKLGTHTIPLFNSKEDVTKDPSKIKKRKQSRATKLCGDLALILGCYKDANVYYTQAFEALKANDDNLWLGKVLESQASCLYLEYLLADKDDQTSTKMLAKAVESITSKIETASINFRKAKSVKSLDFDKECFFKLLRVLKDLGARSNFNDFLRFYVDFLRNSSVIEEQCKIMLKIAGFFYEMNMFRKTALFMKVTADTILQNNLNPLLARDIYLACLPLHNIPLSKEILPSNFPVDIFVKLMNNNTSLHQQIFRTSPMLQLQLVNDILGVPVNDVPIQTKLISIILHYYIQDIDNQAQQRLFSHLITLGDCLNKSLKLDLAYLPEVVKATPVPEVLKVNIRQHENGVDKGNIFIYNPWKKGSSNVVDYNWMVGTMCYVKIYLKNVFEFEIFVDMIMLVTEGVKTINYPTSVIMNKTRSLHELTLKFKPLETGTINVLGVISKLSNFVHFHPINAKGIAIKNPLSIEKLKSKENFGIRGVPIKHRVSTLELWFEDSREEIQLYDGSRFSTRALIENKNECTICLRKALISFAFSDNTTLDKELMVADIEINQHESFSIVICRSIREEEQEIRDLHRMQNYILLNLHGIQNLDRLFKVYVKLIYYEKEKPGISIEDNISREVKMLKSLSLRNLQIYNSITSDKVRMAGKEYKHISIDDHFFISFDVVRDDPEVNKSNYTISIHRRDSEVPLIEKFMLAEHTIEKLIVKVDKKMFESIETEMRQMTEVFYGRWKDLNSMQNGYLFTKEESSATLRDKIENLCVNCTFESDIKEQHGRKRTRVGELHKITAKLKLITKERRQLHISIIASGSVNPEQALLTKTEKGIIYNGKKTFMVEMGGDAVEEASVTVNVMFAVSREYKLFVFITDEENGVVYSYKNPWQILVE